MTPNIFNLNLWCAYESFPSQKWKGHSFKFVFRLSNRNACFSITVLVMNRSFLKIFHLLTYWKLDTFYEHTLFHSRIRGILYGRNMILMLFCSYLNFIFMYKYRNHLWQLLTQTQLFLIVKATLGNHSLYTLQSKNRVYYVVVT